MQSFERTLNFFREKETISLHKYVLQKSSQMAAERRLASRNGGEMRKKPVPVPCVSRRLFEEPVSCYVYFVAQLTCSNFSHKAAVFYFNCSTISSTWFSQFCPCSFPVSSSSPFLTTTWWNWRKLWIFVFRDIPLLRWLTLIARHCPILIVLWLGSSSFRLWFVCASLASGCRWRVFWLEKEKSLLRTWWDSFKLN